MAGRVGEDPEAVLVLGRQPGRAERRDRLLRRRRRRGHGCRGARAAGAPARASAVGRTAPLQGPAASLRAVGGSGVLLPFAVGVLVDPHPEDLPVERRQACGSGRSSTVFSGRPIAQSAMVATAELTDDVGEQRTEHGERVADAAGRAGQVDDQRARGGPGEPAGEHRRRHAVLRAVAADGLGDAGRLPLDPPRGSPRG